MSEIIVNLIYLNHFNFNKKNVNIYFFLDVVVNNHLIYLSSIINRFPVYQSNIYQFVSYYLCVR